MYHIHRVYLSSRSGFRILIKGMMVACRSVFFTLVLLLLITYVFSVAFMTFSRGTELEKGVFSSMGSATLALVMKGIFPDQAPFRGS